VKHLILKLRFIGLVALALAGATSPVAAQAATSPALGSAAGFAVLAGTAATCTTSTITGNVGVNFNPPTTAGCNAQYAPGAFKAFQSELTGTKPPCVTAVGSTFPDATTNLGPGTYCAAAGLTFTDQTLNLTGTGSWFFEIGAGFTGTNLNVVMADGGNPCNVFWWIGADATLTVNKPVSAPFQGTILGGGAITLTGSASDPSALTLTGHVWATTAVTMTNSTIVGCTGGAGHEKEHCNQGVGNGPEGCDPGNSNNKLTSNDENGGTPGDPGRQGGLHGSVVTSITSLTSGATAAVATKSNSHPVSSVSDAAKGKSNLHSNSKGKGKNK
jgi:ice-binding like protein